MDHIIFAIKQFCSSKNFSFFSNFLFIFHKVFLHSVHFLKGEKEHTTLALCPSRIRGPVYLLWRFPGLPGKSAFLPRCSCFLEWPDVAAMESQQLAVQSLLLTPPRLLVVSLGRVGTSILPSSSLAQQLSVRASASTA